VDIARGHMVEKDPVAMIERRSRQKDPAEESELWRESEERYNALLASRRRAEWCEYHKGQAARLRSVLEAAVARHEGAAAALEKS
jgi:hypothetical protein